MSDNHENRLLEAVDDLTKPIIEHLTQKDDDGTFLKIHTAEHLPLLHQLRDAVNPSSNTAAGSSSLASTRNLVDSDALYRYSLITAAIGDWCRIIGVVPTRTPHRDPVTDLRQWYIAYERTGDDGEWYTRELVKWANVIRNLVDRMVERFPVRGVTCPVCKSATFTTDDGEQVMFPILIEYRRPKDGEHIRPKAICRNTDCGATWEGEEAIAELREEVGARHAE